VDQTEERAAKLSDVAKAAGVSQGTVSNVFNRPQIVRAEVREHVLQVAKRLGYRGADPKGRVLRAGKVNAIGVATIDSLNYFFDDPYARTVMSGISEAAGEAGAGISLVSAANAETLGWNIQNALVDGFILFCMEGGDDLARLTRERQLPYVALALGVDDPTIAAIGVDNVLGGRLAAEHLVGLGHRNFAIIGLEASPGEHFGRIGPAQIEGAAFSTTRDRIYGSFDVLRSHGIDTSIVPVFETKDDARTVIAALDDLFATGQMPTAIICQSDRAALIALDWLKARGLRVPGDISVIGFDGVAEGETSTPPLTTIAQPMEEIGRLAVASILRPQSLSRQILPLELVVRQSTASPRR
jgi:DNA-binding LacI/PurR family transcriptional regulator